MRSAPAVRVQGGGGLAWRLLRVGLPALALAVLLAWLFLHLGLSPLAAWLVAAGSGAVLAVAWGRQPQPLCDLVWNGQSWAADGLPVQPQLMIDLGAGLLLRLHPLAATPAAARQSAPRWLALAATECGTAWHGLRAALYAPPRPAMDVAQAPGAASAPLPGPPPQDR